MAKSGDTERLKNWAVIFMEIAGGDIENYRPMDDYVRNPVLANICETVTGSLLNDWNRDILDFRSNVSISEFLRDSIGEKRLCEDSPLIRYAKDADISVQDVWLRREGWDQKLVNPLALMSSDSYLGAHRFDAFIGRVHSDFNVRNILIPTYLKVSPEDYIFIDYGGFNANGLLTWDQMYLLVSLATRWLRDIDLSSSKARSLIRCLANHQADNEDPDFEKEHEVIRSVFHAGYKWAASKSYGDRWVPQCHLSLAAAALVFLGRDIPNLHGPIDGWLFDLAAVALTEYLQITNLESNQVSDLSNTLAKASHAQRRQELEGSMPVAGVGIASQTASPPSLERPPAPTSRPSTHLIWTWTSRASALCRHAALRLVIFCGIVFLLIIVSGDYYRPSTEHFIPNSRGSLVATPSSPPPETISHATECSDHPSGMSCDNQDPVAQGCTEDAVVVPGGGNSGMASQVHLEVKLWWSSRCQSFWAAARPREKVYFQSYVEPDRHNAQRFFSTQRLQADWLVSPMAHSDSYRIGAKACALLSGSVPKWVCTQMLLPDGKTPS
ncbi:hypothetical protein [Nonomuraea sp. NPDC048901]|uniref:hypothetical protein n=1 Tax=Nonomuraea sp. NPDC048901 TaxID=3155627 RepID=UPI0033FFA49E